MNKLILTTILILSSLGYSSGQTTSNIPFQKLYVSTDKYFYEPGQYVYFSCFLTKNGKAESTSDKVKVWIENGKKQVLDSVIFNPSNKLEAKFKLPKEGGMYYLKAISSHQLNMEKHLTFSKEIFVQNIVRSEFFIETTLDKNYYRKGDTINYSCKLKSASSQSTQHLPCQLRLTMDGITIWAKSLEANREGKLDARIPLPYENISDKSLVVETSLLYRGKRFSNSKRVHTTKRKVFVSAYYSSGNKGFFVNHWNEAVIKTTDELGQYIDVEGFLINNQDSQKIPINPLAKGLSKINFFAKEETLYYLVFDGDTLDVLHKAIRPIGFTQEANSLQVQNPMNQELRLVILKGERILIDDTSVQFQPFDLSSIKTPGVISAVLFHQSKKIAHRNFFVNYDKIQRAKLKMDSVVFAGEKPELTIGHPSGKKTVYSLSIVDENNSKQIKDKSHHVISWLLLGAEYSCKIEEPQDYFDADNELAKPTLDLLMHTLHSKMSRDPITGLARHIADHHFTSTYTLSGRLSSRYGSKVGGIWVKLKPHKLSTQTDNQGRFVFELGPNDLKHGFVKARVGGERPETFCTLPYFSSSFVTKGPIVNQSLTSHSVRDTYFTNQIVFKKDLFIDPKASPILLLNNRPRLIKKDETKTNFTEKTIRQLGSRSLNSTTRLSAGVSLTTSGAISFRGSSTDGTAYYQDGVRLIGSTDPVALSTACVVYSSYRTNWSMVDQNMATYYPNTLFYYDPFRSSNYYYSSYYRENDYRIIQDDYTQRKHLVNEQHSKKNTATVYWDGFSVLGEHKLNTIKGEKFLPYIESGSYRIVVEGVDEDGQAFYGETYFSKKQRYDISFEPPQKLYDLDTAHIPLSITNNTSMERTVSINHYGKYKTDVLTLLPKETKQLTYTVIPSSASDYHIEMQVIDGDFFKTISHSIAIEPFHERTTAFIAGNTHSAKTIDLSNSLEGSLQVNLTLAPNMEDKILEVASRLIRQPHGCFEQVSSANYPNLLALNLLLNNPKDNVEKIAQVKTHILNGYNKLINYETARGGFEWYGRNPPHESLTAYGLLQFHLMKTLDLPIDENMFRRNLNWLLSRSDNHGGFHFHKGKYGFSTANYEVNNAYITWVLSRVSNVNLSQQTEAIEKDLEKGFDAYKHALFVNTLIETSQTGKAKIYFSTLKDHLIKKDFKQLDAKKSVMSSWGKSLDIEVIALSLMASSRLHDTVFTNRLKSVLFAYENNRGYYGNTQSTALTLEALSMSLNFSPKEGISKIELYVNGQLKWEQDASKLVKNQLSFNPSFFSHGVNQVEVKIKGKPTLFTTNFSWYEKRKDHIDEELPFHVSYSKKTVQAGEQNQLNMELTNKRSSPMGQVVASVDIPNAYTISTEDLYYLTQKEVINYYEIVNGNTLNLYFLGLKAKETKTIHLSLKAHYGGAFHSRKHFAYEYYHPETRSEVVTPKSLVL